MASMEKILSDAAGKKEILLGNEAIVRGALEAGVRFVSTYPGTPASEIGNTFYKIAERAKIYFEFSTNEKTAMEAGIGASFSGLKTLVAMKSFGLNVASDSLLPFCYTGAKGATLIVVSDDPECWSSAQSEQNSRPYSYLAHLPTLEPSDPQECSDFVKLGFEISERFQMPVLIRLTTRVSHQRAPVKLTKLPRNVLNSGRFVKEPRRFVTMPPRVLEMKKEMLEKIAKIKEFSEKSPINSISLIGTASRLTNNRKAAPISNQKHNLKLKTKELGVITSGISYLYVMEALQELKLELPVLKLGFFYPLPEEKIKKFIKSLKRVLVVEELEPWLENEVKRLAKDVNCDLKVIGKELLPEVGELKPEIVALAVAKLFNKKLKIENLVIENSLKIEKCKSEISRSPRLCPGCPYWFVFGAIKKAVDPKRVVFGGDIGCYMLSGSAPHFLQDYLFSMGSSVGIAHGIKKAASMALAKDSGAEQKLIAFIGDSTFFHSGIPALINTVFNKSNPLIILMDNQTTAMTGHQPNPSAPAEPDGIKIENIIKACGVKHCRVIDPARQDEFIKTIKEFLNEKEVSVIIARHPCVFVKR